jgi:hypothetical protein
MTSNSVATISTAPLVPVTHARRAQALQAGQVARLARATTGTLQLAAHGFDITAVAELMAMQTQLKERFIALQKSWAEGWVSWWHYANDAKGLNTMTKLMERESNIMGQAMALISRQMVDLTGLQESASVGYTYWVQEKLAEKV